MKKLTAIVLIFVLALTLAACGASAPASSQAASGASAVITSVDDLTGKTVGVQLGTTGDIYAEDIEGATIERYNKGTEAIMALQQGKIDAVIIDDQPAKIFAQQNGDIKVLEEAFTVEDYAICVSKDNADLTAAMNTAIAELKADGTLQAILDYYIGGVEGAKPYESAADAAYPNGKLIMATNATFPPYEYHEGDAIVGVDADFAKAICDKMGYELVIEDMDFDAIIPAVQSGKASFGAAGMTVTEDRLKSIDFTDSYCTASQVVIVKK
ncbi:MAG: transporter substrate-binding domain-containing protein [Oscillospiraceae bacterium]|nr:transporter substrate-binding domain-containing protein [Oscillospiraceae bacterium]